VPKYRGVSEPPLGADTTGTSVGRACSSTAIGAVLSDPVWGGEGVGVQPQAAAGWGKGCWVIPATLPSLVSTNCGIPTTSRGQRGNGVPEREKKAGGWLVAGPQLAVGLDPPGVPWDLK